MVAGFRVPTFKIAHFPGAMELNPHARRIFGSGVGPWVATVIIFFYINFLSPKFECFKCVACCDFFQSPVLFFGAHFRHRATFSALWLLPWEAPRHRHSSEEQVRVW